MSKSINCCCSSAQLVLREPREKPLTESRPDMPGHDWEVLKELFYGALPKSPQERTAYLERACTVIFHCGKRSNYSSDPTKKLVGCSCLSSGSRVVERRHQAPTGQVVGHYRIVSLVAEGGMGRVYLAEDTELHRKVSLKFLSPNFLEDEERTRRAGSACDLSSQPSQYPHDTRYQSDRRPALHCYGVH